MDIECHSAQYIEKTICINNCSLSVISDHPKITCMHSAEILNILTFAVLVTNTYFLSVCVKRPSVHSLVFGSMLPYSAALEID